MLYAPFRRRYINEMSDDSTLPKLDPYLLARQIINIYHNDSEWVEHSKDNPLEFVTTLKQCLAGTLNWEQARDRMGDFRAYGIYHDSNQPPPKAEQIQGWIQAIEETLRENPEMREAAQRQGEQGFQCRLPLAEGFIPEKLQPLLATILEAAFLQMRHQVTVEFDDAGIILSAKEKPPALHQQLLQALGQVKQSMAEAFVEQQGEDGQKEYWLARAYKPEALRPLPMALHTLFSGNESEDFVTLAQGRRLRPMMYHQDDPEALDALDRSEQQGTLSHWYVVRQPERKEWLQKYLGVGPQIEPPAP